MEIFKLTKDGKELFVEATPQNYLLATEFGWTREYFISDVYPQLNKSEEIN